MHKLRSFTHDNSIVIISAQNRMKVHFLAFLLFSVVQGIFFVAKNSIVLNYFLNILIGQERGQWQ